MQELNHSKLLGVLAGEAGDYYIGTSAVTTQKFSKIKITAAATLTDVKIRGISVKAARAYPNSMPVGYEMIAGGDDYFDSIEFSAGSAQGYLYPELILPVAASVAVAGGVAEAAMTATITFTNSGRSGSKEIRWRTKDSTGEIVQEGTAVLYFLKGSGVTVTIPGLTYFATVADDYTFEINLTDGDTWIASAAFDITAE